MQLYNTISLKNAWWNICCQNCGAPIADNPYRNVRITWSEVLDIAIQQWNPPTAFFVRDFLISMEFSNNALLTFCSQGPRRGEIDISVPADDEKAGEILRAFMDQVRSTIEITPSPTQDDDGIYKRYDEDDWDDEEGDWEEEEL